MTAQSTALSFFTSWLLFRHLPPRHQVWSVPLQAERTPRPPDREDNRCSTRPAWSAAINHSGAVNEWNLLGRARQGKSRNTSNLMKRKSTDWQWLRLSAYPNGSRLCYSFRALQDIHRAAVGNMTMLMFKWTTDCAFFTRQNYPSLTLAHCSCVCILWRHGEVIN